GFKFVLTLAGARFELYEAVTQAEIRELHDQDLPIYSILLPVYKEPEVIETLIYALSQLDYPKDKFIVVLAGEERDKERFLRISDEIVKKYGDKFFKLLISLHPKNLLAEIPGKGSNTNWAGHQVKRLIDELKIPYENIIVSCFDIDTCVHPKYFSYLTYRYLTVPNPTRTSFQPVAVFNNNIWDSPALTRVVARGTTFWLLTELSKPQLYFTFSSHSMSFKALVEVGFWPKDVVSEDSRIFLICLNHYSGDYKVVPLYISVSMDTVYCGSFWRTLVNQYKQMLRWGYGVENVPWMLWNFFKNKKMPWLKKWPPFWTQYEGSCSWATVPIIILILGYLPIWVARQRNIQEGIVLNAPFILEWLMTIAMIGLFLSAIFSTILLPPRPAKHKPYKYLFMILQWLLFPLTMLIFGAIPATEAVTRLMLGKYLGFRVTEKRRDPRG
ncbi:MAG: glycosyltransferase, partial [Patescibacteria group bacterium]